MSSQSLVGFWLNVETLDSILDPKRSELGITFRRSDSTFDQALLYVIKPWNKLYAEVISSSGDLRRDSK